ncbi:MAG TPA: DUF1294 domain-containing protein [Chthoniobacteraceae bacterium]
MNRPDATNPHGKTIGRRPSTPPRSDRAPTRRHLSVAVIGSLLALLILPGLALGRLAESLSPELVFGYATFSSLITFLFYWRDKRRAQTGQWRIPESTLHLAELLGGWPGAFLAQHELRHKVVKRRYQLVFWLIVIVYQAVSFDFMRNWQYSRLALSLVAR